MKKLSITTMLVLGSASAIFALPRPDTVTPAVSIAQSAVVMQKVPVVKKDTIQNNSALYKAVQNGNASAVYAQIMQGANPNNSGSNRYTVLQLAAQKGNADIVALLIASGANVHTTNKRNETALFLAVRKGYVDVVQILLSHSVDTSIADNRGNTPLHAAKNSKNRAQIRRLLFTFGANPHAVNKVGRTPVQEDTHGDFAAMGVR